MSRGNEVPPWRKCGRSRSRRRSGWQSFAACEEREDDDVEEEQREVEQIADDGSSHVNWMMGGLTSWATRNPDPSSVMREPEVSAASKRQRSVAPSTASSSSQGLSRVGRAESPVSDAAKAGPKQPPFPPPMPSSLVKSSHGLLPRGSVAACVAGVDQANVGAEPFLLPKAKVKPLTKPGAYAKEDPEADCTDEYLKLESEQLDAESLSGDEEVGFEAVLACPHPEDWDEEFKLDEMPEGESRHLLTKEEVQAWAISNELTTPADFIYAFSTACEVRIKLGPVAESVWREFSEREIHRNVSCGWKLLCSIGEVQHLPVVVPKHNEVHVRKLKKLRGSQLEKAQLEKLVGDRDRPERIKQANILFDLAVSWGKPAKFAVQMEQLSQLKALEFRAMEVERIARFDHHSLAAHRMAWDNWVKWCSEQDEPEVPTEPTVVAFPMWLASQKARTSPMALWNHFSWLHRMLGLQWKPSIDEKPKGVRGTIIAGDNQAVPPDPEILLMFEEEADLANFLPNERRPHLDFARMMWLACLRERHVQRSILVKLGAFFLWGVCPRGKSKPGFVWGMPRFTTSDADLGAEIWYKWKDASINAESALQFACVDNDGIPVKAGDAADTVRFLLSKRGVRNPELFTMRGLRRVQPTMLGQRSAPEDEKVAVGDWQQCIQRGGQSVSTMPVLYDGDKVRTAAFTKYIQVEIVRRVSLGNPEKLDWRTFRARMKELEMDQVYQAAESALENDITVDEIPPELVPKWYQPTKQFFFTTDAVRAAQSFQASKIKVDPKSDLADNDAPVGVDEEIKPESSCDPRLVESNDDQSLRVRLGTLPPDVYWQATRSKVHFADDEGEPPWCSQRHGCRAKPLVRFAAAGNGVAMLQGMSLGEHVEVCMDCLKAHGY